MNTGKKQGKCMNQNAKECQNNLRTSQKHCKITQSSAVRNRDERREEEANDHPHGAKRGKRKLWAEQARQI